MKRGETAFETRIDTSLRPALVPDWVLAVVRRC